MNSDSNIYLIIGVQILVVSILVFIYILSRKKLSIESNNKPILQRTCAGRLGMTYFSIPFVRFAVYDNFIVFAYGHKRFHLNFDEIQSIYYNHSFFNRGINFVHNNLFVDKNILLKISKYQDILKVLEGKGIKVITHRD